MDLKRDGSFCFVFLDTGGAARENINIASVSYVAFSFGMCASCTGVICVLFSGQFCGPNVGARCVVCGVCVPLEEV